MYTSRLGSDRLSVEAFQFDLVVAVGGPRADGGVAQLVKVPAGRVPLPERIGLPIRQACMAIGGQISSAGRARFARGDEKRAYSGLAALLQVVV
jgi:hypothetical protein